MYVKITFIQWSSDFKNLRSTEECNQWNEPFLFDTSTKEQYGPKYTICTETGIGNISLRKTIASGSLLWLILDNLTF